MTTLRSAANAFALEEPRRQMGVDAIAVVCATTHSKKKQVGIAQIRKAR